eukprot:tig00000042_g15487.t1
MAGRRGRREMDPDSDDPEAAAAAARWLPQESDGGRGGRSRSRKSRRKPRLSIGALLIGIIVVSVCGAVAFSWSVTWWFGVSTAERLAGQLLRETGAAADAAVSAHLSAAVGVVARTAADFEAFGGAYPDAGVHEERLARIRESPGRTALLDIIVRPRLPGSVSDTVAPFRPPLPPPSSPARPPPARPPSFPLPPSSDFLCFTTPSTVSCSCPAAGAGGGAAAPPDSPGSRRPAGPAGRASPAGRVSASIVLSSLSGTLRAALPMPGSLIFLTTDDGRMVSSTEAAGSYASASGADLDRPLTVGEVASPLVRDVHRAAAAGGWCAARASGTVGSGAHTYLAACAPVSLGSGLPGAVLLVAVPRDEVLADLYRSALIVALTNAACPSPSRQYSQKNSNSAFVQSEGPASFRLKLL